MAPRLQPPYTFIDGGLGTTLEGPPYSFTFSRKTPLWSSHPLISSPSTLASVQTAFVDSGADVILSATYQCSFEGFARTSRQEEPTAEASKDTDLQGPDAGYSRDEAEQYMLSALPIARSSFSVGKKEPCVALSIGPYGATLVPAQEYSGDYPAKMCNEQALAEWHKERLRVFRENQKAWDACDMVAFETLRRGDEILAVRKAATDVFGGQKIEENGEIKRKKWWISGVFPQETVNEKDARDFVRKALERRQDLDVPWGIGVNCTKVEKVDAIVKMFEDEVSMLRLEGSVPSEQDWRPWLVVYPDGAVGLQYNSTTMTWIETGMANVSKPWDEQIFEAVKLIKERGHWQGIIVGGCCKTGPEDIRKLRHRVDEDQTSV